jgi:hypothetical protein
MECLSYLELNQTSKHWAKRIYKYRKEVFVLMRHGLIIGLNLSSTLFTLVHLWIFMCLLHSEFHTGLYNVQKYIAYRIHFGTPRNISVFLFHAICRLMFLCCRRYNFYDYHFPFQNMHCYNLLALSRVHTLMNWICSIVDMELYFSNISSCYRRRTHSAAIVSTLNVT